MSMQMIGGLMVQLAADVAALRKDMDEAEKVVDKSAVAMQKGLGLLKGAFVGLAGAISVGALASWVKAAADAGDEMKAFSQKTGVAVEDVAGLTLAFKQGGVETGQLQGAIAKMSKQMAEGGDAFKKLGVETRNSDGTLRSAKDVLYDVADATKDMGSSMETTALLQGVFGKSAADLLPTLLDGSDGLKQMDEMARKLGLTMDSETADAADKFNDTVELLGLGLTGVGRQVAAQLLPTLSNLAESFLTSMTEGDRLKRIAEGLSTVFKLMYTAVVGVVEIFNTMGKVLGGVVARLMAEISGLGEAIVKVFQGDFKGAAEAAQNGFKTSAEIGRIAAADIKQGWSSTGETIAKVWGDTSGKTVDDMAAMEKAGRKVTLQTKEQEEAAKKAAEAEKKRLAEVEKLTAGINKQIATMAAEQEQSTKLTAVQKQALDIMLKIQDGTLKMTDAEKREIVAKLEQAFASEKYQIELAKEKKWLEETGKENDKFRETTEKNTDAINKQVKQQQLENETIGKTKEQLADLEAARLRAAAATAEQNAVDAESQMLGEELVSEYKKQAEGLRELAKLKGDKVHLEAAVEAADAWKKTSQEIGSSLTDSLFRAFESGKSFGDALMDGLKNMFKTTVLKLVIQPVQNALNNTIGNMLGSVFGGGATSGSGGGFGGFGSIFSSLSSMFSGTSIGSTVGGWMSSLGGWMSGGAGSLGTGPLASMGGWLSSTGTAMGSMSGAGAGAGAGAAGAGAGGFSMASAWPLAVIAGMLAANSAYSEGWSQNDLHGPVNILAPGHKFDTNLLTKLGVSERVANIFSGASLTAKLVNWGAGTQHTGSTAFANELGVGTSSGSELNFLKEAHERNTALDETIRSVAGSSAGVLNALSDVFGGKKFSVSTGFADDTSKDGAWGALKIMMGGGSVVDWAKTQTSRWAPKEFANGEEGVKEYLAAVAASTKDAIKSIGLPEWAQSIVDKLGNGATLEQLTAAVVQIAATEAALGDLKDEMSSIGGIFGSIGNLSADATLQLAQFAGGMEQLVAKSRQFVTDYYSDTEKLGVVASQLQKQLEGLGVDSSGLTSKEAFRALVESQQLNTEEGRKLFAQLLDLAPSFAQVGDYLKENNTTLEQLAQAAPASVALQAMADQNKATQNQQQAVTDQLVKLDDTTFQAGQATVAAIDRLNEKMDRLAVAVESSIAVGNAADRALAKDTYANGAFA